MGSLTKLLDNPSGNSLQLLVRDVVPHLTPTDNASCETVAALLAVNMGLLGEMMSGDSLFLALSFANDLAEQCGVSHEEIGRVTAILLEYRQKRMSSNPLSGLF